ncbi:hypothetical protein quinque_010804 [Culex quinquefasciatus]
MFESGRRARSLDRITPGSGGSSSGYQTRSKTKNTSPFLSENRFDALGDDDVGDGVEQQKKEPRVRIPPIFIVGKSVADVVKLLNINGVPQGDDYMLKFTKATVQFLTKSKELFTTTVALLKRDFNARHRQWNCLKANRAGSILVSRAASSDFFIHAPPAFTYQPPGGRRPSTLDIVLSNNLVNMSSLTVVNDLSSDHLPVRFDVDVSVPFRHARPSTKCYNRANWQTFQRIVNEKIDLTSPITTNLASPEAIDRCVEFFTCTLLEAEAAAVPTVPVRTYEDSKFPEIARQLVTLRNTCRRQWYRTRDPLLGAIVESLNNRIRFECSIARNQHFSNNIRNLENGAKDVWKISKALRNQVKYSPPLQAGDTLKASPVEKANLLADNFARAHRNPSPGDPATCSAVEESVQLIADSTFPVESVPVIRPKEIARIIKSLKAKKAPGEDKIRNTLLKRLPRKGLVMLTLIVNACLRTSYFPSSWKHAIVTAIPKPGKDITNPTNYRPISLLPVMSKILERVMLIRIESLVEQRNIVPPQQFGFKRGHSTNHQLARLTRNVKNSLARGDSAGMVLLDVEKAYDSVWQDAILHKMKLAGFPPYILKLLNSFLKQRSFQVAPSLIGRRDPSGKMCHFGRRIITHRASFGICQQYRDGGGSGIASSSWSREQR